MPPSLYTTYVLVLKETHSIMIQIIVVCPTRMGVVGLPNHIRFGVRQRRLFAANRSEIIHHFICVGSSCLQDELLGISRKYV